MSVDRFGNVQLSIPAADAGRLGIGVGSPVVVRCSRRQLTVPYLETFAAVAPGEIVAFTDSAGLISLAVNAGDAAAATRPAAGGARAAGAGPPVLRPARRSGLGAPYAVADRRASASPGEQSSKICPEAYEQARTWHNAVDSHGRQIRRAAEVPPPGRARDRRWHDGDLGGGRERTCPG